jgi:hypothetical protein
MSGVLLEIVMGMSTHVVAVRALDDSSKFEKMLNLKDACETAGVDYPQECVDFFKKVSDLHPGESAELLTSQAMDIDLKYDIKNYPELANICQEWSDDMQSGFEVEVSKIPSWIKKIRFYNSW